MAFLSRVGNILKQSIGRQADSCFSASNPSIYQAIRLMSSSKIFIGGLSYGTDDTSLREAFSQYGEIVDARVIVDRDSGRSRGFGFVTYTSDEEASSAIQALDGQELHGRRVRVAYATDRARGGGFGGGLYGGGGGGYGGGGYGSQGGYGGGGFGDQGGYGGGSYSGGASSYGGGYGGGGGGFGASGQGGAVGYGSGGANYGGDYGGGSSGGVGSYGGGGGGNYSVAGGGGGSDTAVFGDSGFTTGGNSGVSGGASGYVAGDSGFASSGSEEGSALGNSDRGIGEPAGKHEPSEPMDRNYRDEDKADDDYAKRA